MSDIKYSTYIDDVAFKKAFELYNQRAEERYADIPKESKGENVLLVGSGETSSDASITYKVPNVKYTSSDKTLSVPNISATESISAGTTISAPTVEADNSITFTKTLDNKLVSITINEDGIKASESFPGGKTPTITGFKVTSEVGGAIENLSYGSKGYIPYQEGSSDTGFFASSEAGQAVFSKKDLTDNSLIPEFRKIKLADISDVGIATEDDIKGLFTKATQG